MWLATAEGLSVLMTYAEVSARIRATPNSQRERLKDGALILGAWTVRRLS